MWTYIVSFPTPSCCSRICDNEDWTIVCLWQSVIGIECGAKNCRIVIMNLGTLQRSSPIYNVSCQLPPTDRQRVMFPCSNRDSSFCPPTRETTRHNRLQLWPEIRYENLLFSFQLATKSSTCSTSQTPIWRDRQWWHAEDLRVWNTIAPQSQSCTTEKRKTKDKARQGELV